MRMNRTAARFALWVCSLLVAAALAGCLPSEEDTLGTSPPGNYTIAISFSTPSDLDKFGQPTPALAWYLCDDATQCLLSGGNYPAIRSPTMSVSAVSCVELSPADGTSWIRFGYATSSSAFAVRMDGSPLQALSYTLNYVDTGKITVPFGQHTYTWCITGTSGSDNASLDQVTYGAE